jgi:hypothetical protein
MGTPQALRAIVAAPYVLLAGSVAAGWLPAACLAAAGASLPGAAQLLRFCAQHHVVPEAIRCGVCWRA